MCWECSTNLNIILLIWLSFISFMTSPFNSHSCHWRHFPFYYWNDTNDRTSLKFGGDEIEASYWSRAQNRGLWLVESRRFQKFKSSAFRLEIPVIPLISASFRSFWSHSWDEISFCSHQIHYGMTAVWHIPLHSKLIQTQPISLYIHSISWTPSPIRAQSLCVLGMSLKSQ